MRRMGTTDPSGFPQGARARPGVGSRTSTLHLFRLACPWPAMRRLKMLALPLEDSHHGSLGPDAHGRSGRAPRRPVGAPSGGAVRVLSELGRGAMGRVLRAHDPKLGRDVAVKLLAPGASEEHRLRFEQEARAAGALNHPNSSPYTTSASTPRTQPCRPGAPYTAVRAVSRGTTRVSTTMTTTKARTRTSWDAWG